VSRRGWAAVALAACAALLPATVLPRAQALHARHAQLQGALQHNAFNRPLHLDSRETDSAVFGEVLSEVPAPFDLVRESLARPAQWCEILILHLNTKHCRQDTNAKPQRLDVIIGRKADQPLEDAHRLSFSFRAESASHAYLRVELDAESGPLGTRDYRIVLEAVPLGLGRTVLRLRYSYGYGLAGRLALQAYLATAARDKVGFTIVGQEPRGQAVHVGGVRGLVERNTMRYQLAIEAHLGAQSSPPEARFERSLRDWFAASARHPRQLHEIEQAEYLEMKRREHARR
jgi:hypothetical protein